MRFKITIGIAALALGVAVASGPALAQQGPPGHSSDGGVIAAHPRHHVRAKALFDVVPQRKQKESAPYYGRNVNGGGPFYGRNVNDDGIVQ
jgi:hypothetical protein